MKPKFILHAVCLMLSVTASCTQDLEIDGREIEPKVVLNCVASGNSPLKAAVSRTVVYNETDRRRRHIADATVMLTVNGTPHSQLTLDPADHYKAYAADYVPRAGDRIRLDVNTHLGRVWAEDVMPTLTPIEKVDFHFVEKTNNGSPETVYRITFTDNPSERNFYFVGITDKYNMKLWLDFSKDEVFRPALDGLNAIDDEALFDIFGGGMAFSDDLINGKTYTLRIAEVGENGHAHRRVDRIIKLYSVSQSYYRYLRRIFNESEDSFNNALIEAGLAEPTPHHTNINGGTGILGMMQVAKDTVNIGLDVEENGFPTW